MCAAQFFRIIVSFAGVGVVFERENLPVAMPFVKCGRLKGKGVHKGIFAAAPFGLFFRSLQEPAPGPLPPELFADEKILDAEPVAEGLACQAGELPACLVFQKYADGNVLRRFAMLEIIFFNISKIS